MSHEFSFTQLAYDLYIVWLSLAPLLMIGAILSSILHVSLPTDFIRRALSGRWGVIKAVLVGVPLPLCSCGVIPAGLGLKRDGASDGATVGFLISTPQTGLDSILVSGSLLGLPFALYKVLAAAITGIFGGLLTEKLVKKQANQEEVLRPSNTLSAHENESVSTEHSAFKRASIHFDEVLEPIWLWVIVGVVVSVAIQYVLPRETMSTWSGFSLFIPYLLTLTISLPLYVCATASVPIAASLVAQGFPIGVALIFLMAGPATNIATLGAVLKALGKKAFTVYLSTIIVGSILFALSLDLLLAWKAPNSVFEAAQHQHEFAMWEIIMAGLLALAFMKYLTQYLALILKKLKAKQSKLETKAIRQIKLKVSGLTCQGCVRRLEGALLKNQSIVECQVNSNLDELRVDSDLEYEQVKSLVQEAGYEAYDIIETH